MDARTRSSALRAAARLAWGSLALSPVAGWTGCAGKVAADPATNSTDPKDSAAPGPQDSGERACVGTIDLPPSVTQATSTESAAALACCRAHLHAALGIVPDGGQGVEGGGAARLRADPGLVNCCKAIIADSTAKLDAVADWALEEEPLVRSTCCFDDVVAPATDLYAYPLCTPWGPPMPPDMETLGAEVA